MEVYSSSYFRCCGIAIHSQLTLSLLVTVLVFLYLWSDTKNYCPIHIFLLLFSVTVWQTGKWLRKTSKNLSFTNLRRSHSFWQHIQKSGSFWFPILFHGVFLSKSFDSCCFWNYNCFYHVWWYWSSSIIGYIKWF